MTDYKKLFELKQDDWISACKEIDQLRAELAACQKERDRYRRALREVQKDVVAMASDTVWTHDCASMTAVERIESALGEE